VPGQKPPFEELYREFLNRIYAFVRTQVGNQADAEDVTAQVFIKAYEAYDRFELRAATPAAWLFQIARNASLDHHRRVARRDRLVRTVAAQPEAEVDPGLMAEELMQYQQLMELVAGLPDRQREVISLRHSGLSFLEVGSLLECSEDAAKMLYHRAVKAVRAALPAEGPR
jgi:RNA polymerase sigma-70 factor (ECF subfamily)